MKRAGRDQVRQPGFSLSEVLVVMALIGVVTAFAAPSLIRIGNNANLRAARGALVTAVNVAKSSAVGIRVNNTQTDTLTITKSGSSRYVVVGNFWRVN